MEVGSAAPVQIREVVPELSNAFQRLNTYGRMMNDAGVDVSMRAGKTPVLGAEFFVEPYDEQDINQEISEFIWANLAEGLASPFINSLEDILHFYEDGYSVLEKVYENRAWTPKGKGKNTRVFTMLRKLGVRPASTIKEILYDDNGGPNGVVQNAIRADGKTDEVPIDISKLLIFTFGRKGGDLTGKSLLRTAYPHWYYKSHLYKIDAIQKERHSLGVPKGRLLPGWNEKDREILRQLLANIRSNEEAFMVLTPTVDVEFAEVHGQLVNVMESASHHNTMILMNVMAQFLTMGVDSPSGGRATAGNQTDMFLKTLRFVANYIVEVVNMYLIPELVVWNYKTNSFPQLKVRNIGEMRDLQMLGSALGNLFSQDALTTDLPTENWVRRVFDMPAKQLDAEQTVTPPAPPVGGLTQGGGSNGAQTKPAQPTTSQKGTVKRGSGQPGKPPNAAG
jgi:hypothetical protein